LRAGFLHEADPAVGRAEGDEVLAEQPHPLGRAVGLELGRAARRHPIFAQHRAHRRARPDPGQQLVVCAVEHLASPLAGETTTSSQIRESVSPALLGQPAPACPGFRAQLARALAVVFHRLDALAMARHDGGIAEHAG
jgi:hypothetical protein